MKNIFEAQKRHRYEKLFKSPDPLWFSLQNVTDNRLFLVDATEPVLKRKYIALQIKVQSFVDLIRMQY